MVLVCLIGVGALPSITSRSRVASVEIKVITRFDHRSISVDCVNDKLHDQGAWVRVMVVVPALSKTQNRNPDVVGGSVAGWEPLRSPHVGGRVYEISCVQADYGPQECQCRTLHGRDQPLSQAPSGSYYRS